MPDVSKDDVRSFWEAGACGEVYASGDTPRERYDSHADARYELEPYIPSFARFHEGGGKDVLEIGVGMGADHAEWAKHQPRRLVGVDLTETAVLATKDRLEAYDLRSDVRVGDAENLPFDDESFDIVYSWGVVHHSPDTRAAIREIHRVLRPGGSARLMIYHRPSLVGLLLWARYALLAGKPRRSLAEVCAAHLESPGTKTYSIAQARQLMSDFATSSPRSRLSFGDLLQGEVGQLHGGKLLTIAKRLWPRPLLRRLHPLGLYLLIDAKK